MKAKDHHYLIKAHVNVVEGTFSGEKNEDGVKLNTHEYDINTMNKTFSKIRKNYGCKVKRKKEVGH